MAKRLRIAGRVQGVGYRAAMVSEAVRLGVRGWVRNRRDGSVEALIDGDAAALDAILAWAGTGPPGARVVSLDSDENDGGECTGFELRPSA